MLYRYYFIMNCISETNFSESLTKTHQIFIKEMYLKIVNCYTFCSSLRVLAHCGLVMPYGDVDLSQHCLR